MQPLSGNAMKEDEMHLTQRFKGLRFLGRGGLARRREVVDLLAVPTEALSRIRRKAGTARTLSRAEWTVVANVAQHGLETIAMTYPNRFSADSLIAILDAFSAVYDLRTVPHTRHDPYYLGNLPAECRPAAIDEAPTSTAVRTVVAETRRRLRERVPGCFPWLAGRNLRALLADEPLPGDAAIHRALRPHWPGLWRFAVEGHEALTGQALPDVPGARDVRAADDRRL
jgi:hypothetical protein